MQVTCLVLVLPRVVARGGAEKGAGKGRHKLRDSGGWELKTVKTWAFADLTLLLFSLAGNTENKYKKANTMNVASGSVFNLIILWLSGISRFFLIGTLYLGSSICF